MSSHLSLSASQHERNSRFIQGIFPVNVFTASTFILDKARPIPRGFFFFKIIYSGFPLHIFSLDLYFFMSSDHWKIIPKWVELVPLRTSLFFWVTSEETGVMFGAVNLTAFGFNLPFFLLEISQILSWLRRGHRQ